MRGLRFRSGLAVQLAIGFMAVSGTLLMLYGYIASQMAERTLRDELGKKLSDMAFLATADRSVMAVPLAVRDGQVVSLARERLSAIVKTSGIANLAVVNRSDEVIVDARGTYRFREHAPLLQLDRAELERVWDGEIKASRVYEGMDGSLYLSAYAPLVAEGQVRAVVAAEASAAFLENIRDMRRHFALTGAVVLVLAGFLGWVVAGTITRPVRILRSAADRLARGDYRVRADVRGPQELGDLARAFNRMAQAINANYARILEGMSDGLAAVDEAGAVTALNRSAEEFLGLKRDAVLGRPARGSLPGWLADILAETLGQGVVHQGVRLTVSCRQGPTIVEVSTTQLRDADGALRGAEAEFSDRTELERLTQALEAQKRFSAMGEMAATVAHEVRNPLASIQGFADLLRMEVGDSGKAREYLGDLLGEVSRMEKIVGSFLLYARPPRPELSPVSAEETVRELARSMTAEFVRAGVTMEVAAEPSPRIHADAKMFQMVLANLVRNALEACRPGGRVAVAVSPSQAGVPGVRVTVSDDGSGLAPEMAGRLFAPFATTKAQGTGLGLSLAKKFTDAHGGTISLAALDKGTRAEITFPIEPVTDEEA